MKDVIIQYTIEAVVLIGGILGTAILRRVSTFLQKKNQSSSIGILDTLTDMAVELVEAELKGAKGEEKKKKAISYATQWALTRGIIVNESEINAGIENGVNKLKSVQNTSLSVAEPLVFSTTFEEKTQTQE